MRHQHYMDVDNYMFLNSLRLTTEIPEKVIEEIEGSGWKRLRKTSNLLQ